MITIKPKAHKQVTDRGFSLIELVIVLAIGAILTAIALPQLRSSRRLQRLSALPRQVTSQLRLARQMAMSQRRAVTFQYNDQTKQVSLIAHASYGPTVLTDSNYPNTTGSVQFNTFPLTGDGISTQDITYGIPSGAPTTALDDGISMSSLSTNTINITFQPDGSVINGSGQPTNFSLFFYNGQLPKDTASAISILGSAGRVKIWRYSSNATKYIE
jgi:prepilin-type N-terminal cleavage/methylation domain-containing protein